MTKLEVRRTVPGTTADVFRAWTEPRHMERWLAPGDVQSVTVESELRVGGTYRIHMQAEAGEYTAFGEYREIEPDRRLVFTWDWAQAEHAMGPTVVTVELHPVEAGTEVTVVHELPEKRVEGHRVGWDSCLDRLEQLPVAVD